MRARTRVDLGVELGSVHLRNPVMTASGTSGHGVELAPYLDLATLGAVVVKSLSAHPWPGNPPPRLHESPAGMLNAVGLQGPGVEAWLRDDIPGLVASGATVVASIWGRSTEEYRQAATMLADAPDQIVAVEVNLSCPNVESRESMFAHSPSSTSAAVEAAMVCGRPLWAKLSPNVTELAPIARAAHRAGAEAVTLVNTVMALSIDPETRRPRLGNRGGGLSGPAIHPIAVRAVWDVHRAVPELPIIGVGGIASGSDAVEMLLAGASAVQVGTASFVEPGAAGRILAELEDWCGRHGVRRVGELTGGAHG